MKPCLIILLLCVIACKQNKKAGEENIHGITELNSKPSPVVTIKLLPIGKTTEAFISSSYSDLKKFVPNIEILPHEEMPGFAFYPPRNRFRADSIISWLSSRAKANEVYLAITMQDISTTKGNNPDHGIMGLGYHPGNACIASNYRVRDKKNFYKVVIHELGHTAGLPHCPEKTCFMRDAEGRDPTGEEKEFCKKCKEHLKTKEWNL